MGLAQKHRAGDGHRSGRGNHSTSRRGYSGWDWSAGEMTLAWDRCRTSVLTEVRGHSGHGQLVWAQSVSLVVILVKVRWSGGHLNDDGATLAQVYLSGGQLTCIRQLLWPRSDGLGVPLTRSVRLGVLEAHLAWLRMDGRKPRSWHSQARRRAMGETSGAAALLLEKEQEGPEPQRDSRSWGSLSGNLEAQGGLG